MKRISVFLLAAVCALPGGLRAEDAATEERLNQLSAKIEILIEGQKAQSDRIAELEKGLSNLQRQNKGGESTAGAEGLRQLEDKLREVDRKRIEDNELILKELKALEKKLAGGSSRSAAAVKDDPTPVPSTGYDYVIQSGDTLSVIVAAYKEKNIKVTVEQILKANPGLEPKKMKVGQKIFIPAPGP